MKSKERQRKTTKVNRTVESFRNAHSFDSFCYLSRAVLRLEYSTVFAGIPPQSGPGK